MTEQALTRTVTIVNHEGFHLRATTLLVNLARRFRCEIAIVKGNLTVDGKSTPLHLLGLDAHQGDELTLKATGPDAQEALDALATLVASHFAEDMDDGAEEGETRSAVEE